MRTIATGFAALVTILLSGAAVAAEEEDSTEADERLSAAICAPYGPGFHLVPGTRTCVRISGYVGVEVTVGSGGGRDDGKVKRDR
jgi:hypothetical protein